MATDFTAPPSGAGTDSSASTIAADIGSLDLGSAPVDTGVATEVSDIPEDEPEITDPVETTEGEGDVAEGEQPPPDEPAPVEDDSQRPEIANLSESRWKKVHGGYKWAQEVGKALGIVGEDGKVDLTQFPTVAEIQESQKAYSDRIAMEHDFASGDPENAKSWIENWHQFSPDGMNTVAAMLPQYLAEADPKASVALAQGVASVFPKIAVSNPHAAATVVHGISQALPQLAQQPQIYNRLAVPILQTFIDAMVLQGLQESDPKMVEYKVGAARAAEWFLNGCPPQGGFRSDEEYKALLHQRPARQQQQPQNVQSIRQPQATPEARELAQIKAERQKAHQEAITRDVDNGNLAILNPTLDKVFGKLKTAYGQNAAAYNAVREKFVQQVLPQQMGKDEYGLRQYNIALEKAMKSGDPVDKQAVNQAYDRLLRRAMTAVAGGYITEHSKGFVAASEAKHAQHANNASKVGVTAPGAPRRQSIAGPLTRKPGETAAQFTLRQVQNDLQGVA